MVNSSEVISQLKEKAKVLHSLQEDSSSAPFLGELESIEQSTIVTFEKIEVLTGIEKLLLSINGIFQLYGLQLSCGKLLLTFKVLF